MLPNIYVRELWQVFIYIYTSDSKHVRNKLAFFYIFYAEICRNNMLPKEVEYANMTNETLFFQNLNTKNDWLFFRFFLTIFIRKKNQFKTFMSATLIPYTSSRSM